MPPLSLCFAPSRFQGLARIDVLLDSNHVGIIAQQQRGPFEFIPHRSGSFCRALRLPNGPHVADNENAMRCIVRKLLEAAKTPSTIPEYVAMRPDGRPWERTFFSETAAWRAMVKGAASKPEWRRRKAELERLGWMVKRSE